MITSHDDLVAVLLVGLLAILTVLWIALLAINLAETGEVRVFGATTGGPAALGQMIDILAVQRGVR